MASGEASHRTQFLLGCVAPGGEGDAYDGGTGARYDGVAMLDRGP